MKELCREIRELKQQRRRLTATATKTSLKKYIIAALNFFALILAILRATTARLWYGKSVKDDFR